MIDFAPLRDSLPDHDAILEGGGAREHVLLVEDDIAMVQALECYFRSGGLQAVTATTVAAAKRCFDTYCDWVLVVSDFHLPDGTGWELCRWIRQHACPPPPFLLISGAAGADAYASQVSFLAKPFTVAQLDQSVDQLIGSAFRRGTPANRPGD